MTDAGDEVDVHQPAPAASEPTQASPRRETSKVENEVVEHLLFHRSFADHDPGQIDRLVALATEDMEAGFPDPFDRAIALAFALVLEEGMDPWRIDLVQFSKLYAERVAATAEVDLITAGRLLAMAWAILLRQTEGLLDRAQPPDPPEESWDLPWDQVPEEWIDPEDADVAFTQRVLSAPRAPLTESVFHQGNRRVTLYELVEALEEARQEAEVRMRLTAERAKARAAAKDQGQQNMKKIHKEDLEAEILDVRRRLQRVEGEVTFALIHDGSREDFLTAFISCLFLHRAEMVNMRQEDFPIGPMLVEPLSAIHDPDAPLIGLPDKGPAAAKRNGGPRTETEDEPDDDDGADDDRERAAPAEAGPHA